MWVWWGVGGCRWERGSRRAYCKAPCRSGPVRCSFAPAAATGCRAGERAAHAPARGPAHALDWPVESRACEVRISGADTVVVNLAGGIDGVYRPVACNDGRPMYLRHGSPLHGMRPTAGRPSCPRCAAPGSSMLCCTLLNRGRLWRRHGGGAKPDLCGFVTAQAAACCLQRIECCGGATSSATGTWPMAASRRCAFQLCS